MTPAPSGPPPAPQPVPAKGISSAPSAAGSGKTRASLATVSLIVAIGTILIGMWLLIAGDASFLTTLVLYFVLPAGGIVCGILGRKSDRKAIAVIGIVLNALFLAAMTFLFGVGVVLWLLEPV